jgi:hypothetical protein
MEDMTVVCGNDIWLEYVTVSVNEITTVCIYYMASLCSPKNIPMVYSQLHFCKGLSDETVCARGLGVVGVGGGGVIYLDINFLKVTFREYNFYSYTCALVFLIPS